MLGGRALGRCIDPDLSDGEIGKLVREACREEYRPYFKKTKQKREWGLAGFYWEKISAEWVKAKAPGIGFRRGWPHPACCTQQSGWASAPFLKWQGMISIRPMTKISENRTRVRFTSQSTSQRPGSPPGLRRL
jgi:hypothetical protein